MQSAKSDATLRLLMLLAFGSSVWAFAAAAIQLQVICFGSLQPKNQSSAMQAVQEIGRSLSEDVERVTQPAIRRGRLLAESVEVADAISRSDAQSLTDLCNRSILNATEMDAIALFDAAGKILAVNSVYANGQTIPEERVKKVLQSDFSNRQIIHRCLNNQISKETLEFQTTCDITPAFFDSSGLSIAYSVPVFNNEKVQLGVVSIRLRFDRVSTLIANRKIAEGLGSVYFVTDQGGFFDESINSGGVPPLESDLLKSIVAPFLSSDANQITVERKDKVHLFFRVQNLKTLDGGGIQTMVTVPRAWVYREAHLANILSVGGSFAIGTLLIAMIWGLRQQQNVRHERDSGRRLAVIAQRTTSAVICCDQMRRIVWVNEWFTRMTGYEFQEVIGLVITEFFDRDLAEGKMDQLRQSLNDGIAFRGEILNRRKDGQEYWSDVEFQPIISESGSIQEFVLVVRDITEQTIERQRLKSVFSAVTEGIVLQNDSGEIVECNIAAERILGLTFDQMRGRTSMDSRWQAIHEDGSPLTGDQHPAMRTLRTGQPVRSFVFGIHTPEGSNRWISVNSEPIFDSTGNVSAVVASFADITQIREQSQRLQVIMDATKIGTWDWEIPTGHVVFNEHWASMLGYELDELEPNVSTWERILDPDGIDQAWIEVQRHISGETDEYRNEMRLRRKDGSFAWVLAAGKIISRRSDGTPNRMVGLHLDITDSKAHETKLKELAERYAAVTTGTSDGLWDWNCNTENCWYSDRYWILLGFSEVGPFPEPTLRSFSERIHPEDVTSVWNAVRQHHQERIDFDHEFRLRHENGLYLWFRMRGASQFDGDGQPVRMAGSIQEIDDLKSAQNSLIEANIRAEAANAAKSEFLANMSHEIRTPMTAILGFADLLMNEINAEEGPPSGIEFVDTIRRNGEHLLEIINDILDMSKIESGKMSVECCVIHPEWLINDVVSLMGIKAQAKGIQLSAIFDSNIPTSIQSDAVRLRQILVNLVGNAIKFTELGNVTIRVRCSVPEQLLYLAIEDTGIGISEEQKLRLFGAFEQADSTTTRQYGGSGLGLFISNRLAQMLGGKIEVESRIGSGSTFTVSIATGPLADNTKPEHHPSGTYAPVSSMSRDPNLIDDRPLAGMRILFAEDGPDNQRLISHVLRKAGAEVQVAENGKAAIEMLTVDGTFDSPLRNPSPFHLLLCDMQMPVMDGYTTARWLRTHVSSLPIIALTANAMNEDAKLCIDAGCNAYASKPINKGTLIALCQEWAGDSVRPLESSALVAAHS